MSIKEKLANPNLIMAIPFTLSVIFMQAFWIFPWLLWISKLPAANWPEPPLGLFSIAVLVGVSFLSTKFFLERRMSLALARFGILGCCVLSIILVIRLEYGAGTGLFDGSWFEYIGQQILGGFSGFAPMITALVAAALTWWLGIHMGRSRLDSDDIFRHFVFGTIALVLVIIIGGATLGTEFLFSATSVWIQLAGFFFFGLLAMALANLKTIQQKMAEGMSRALHRRWLSILLVVIGSVVAAAIALASAVSTEFVASLTRMMGIASDAIFKIASYIFLPIGYVIEFIHYIIMKLVNFFSGGNAGDFDMGGTGEMAEVPESTVTGLPPEVVVVLKWVFFALVVAGVLFLLGKAIFRYTSAKGREEIEETHESLLSWGLLKSDLKLMLERLRRMAPSRQQSDKSAPLPEWYSDTFTGMLDIRQIYKCLMWEASRIDIDRGHCETPNEYAGRISRKLPESREILDEITGMYIETRYGDREFRTGILEYANYKWKNLRKLLRGPEDGEAA